MTTNEATSAHQTTAAAKRAARELFAAHGITIPAKHVQAGPKYVRLSVPAEDRAAALAIPGVVADEDTWPFAYIPR